MLHIKKKYQRAKKDESYFNIQEFVKERELEEREISNSMERSIPLMELPTFEEFISNKKTKKEIIQKVDTEIEKLEKAEETDNKIKNKEHMEVLKDVIITLIDKKCKKQASLAIKDVCKLSDTQTKEAIRKAKSGLYTISQVNKKKANKMAHKLKKAGVSVTIVDSNNELLPFT